VILEWIGIREETYDPPNFYFDKANWDLFTQLSENLLINKHQKTSINNKVKTFTEPVTENSYETDVFFNSRRILAITFYP
jgi:hypothetical protein